LVSSQQFQNEGLVVCDRVHLGVQPGKHVQRGLRLDAADAGNRRDQLIGQIALAAQATALGDQVVDALVAAQRRLDRPLARHVRAQRRLDIMFRPSM
jgi:hypothetical protein